MMVKYKKYRKVEPIIYSFYQTKKFCTQSHIKKMITIEIKPNLMLK